MTIILILAALATARITRLITADRITERPRLATVNAALARDWDLAAYLITCPWCVSIYTGAGMGAAWWAWGDQRWFVAVVAALAFSHTAGFLASREDH
ncbi:hypothetical protein ABZ456_29125 [Streptomyces sp. NPDC005776]|uniref:hypothetical protein n=1 Tax=Streptomyces sp. NPDC005776 TaxID=3154676 RepID=UPI00340475CD